MDLNTDERQKSSPRIDAQKSGAILVVTTAMFSAFFFMGGYPNPVVIPIFAGITGSWIRQIFSAPAPDVTHKIHFISSTLSFLLIVVAVTSWPFRWLAPSFTDYLIISTYYSIPFIGILACVCEAIFLLIHPENESVALIWSEWCLNLSGCLFFVSIISSAAL